MEGMQESQGAQSMPGMQGTVLDRLEAAVAQNPEQAREAISQIRAEVQNLSPEQKAQLREGVERLQPRLQNLTDEQRDQIKDIVSMLQRG